MRTIDFAPLYRSVVGFDRLASLLDAATAEAAMNPIPARSSQKGTRYV